MATAVRGRRHLRRGPTRSHAYAARGGEYVAAGGRARQPGAALPFRPDPPDVAAGPVRAALRPGTTGPGAPGRPAPRGGAGRAAHGHAPASTDLRTLTGAMPVAVVEGAEPGLVRSWRDGGGAVWRAEVVAEGERPAYDAFVRGSVRGHPLQLWSWGEVKRGDGWTPLRLALRRSDRLVAAASLVEKRLAASGPRLWLAHRGPVVAPDAPEAALLWQALRELAARRGVVALRCDPEWPPEEARLLRAAGLQPLPPRAGWYLGALEPLRVWRISLSGGLDAVFARCEAHTRYDVRRALRRGVVVRPATRADLPAFWALERTAATRKAFALRSPEFFDRLWHAWNGCGGGGRLLVGEYEGRVVSGAWFVVCGRGCWGQFAAADLTYRRLNPTVAVYWAGIRWAIERGCAFCDFGGVGHIPDPADGLWAFKKGFGPGDTRFAGEFDLVVQGPAYRAFRVAEEARWAWYGRRGPRQGGGRAAAP